jgi:transforming growth factor-beta-induced protein
MNTLLVLSALLVVALARQSLREHKIHHASKPESKILEQPHFDGGQEGLGESSEEKDDQIGPTSINRGRGFPVDSWDNFMGRRHGGGEFQNFFSRMWNRLYNKTQGWSDLFDGDNGFEDINPDEDAFGRGFFSLLKPWWKGPNVCTREEEYEEKQSEDGVNVFSSLLTSCQDIGDVYKCTMKVGKDGKVNVRTLLYQCCHGWQREPGKKGCTKKLELKTLSDTLQQLNMTEFLKTLQETQLEKRVNDGNFTLFVPDNQAMSTLSASDEINFVISETDDRLNFIRDILKNHIIEGWKFSHLFEDESKLLTDKDGSFIRINQYSYPRPFTTANCARVTSSDNEAIGGLIHTVDRVLLPARQTLWEILGQDQRFSIFSSLISEEMREKLNNVDNHYTVLAFTDSAFGKLSADIQQKIKNTEGCFDDLINEHILPHTICTEAVQGEAVVKNLANHLINASRQLVDGDSLVSFEGNEVVSADRMATNGVIQVLDGVIMLEHMLDAIQVSEKRQGQVFAGLIKTNDLASQVKSAPVITLFVPTNEALMELPEPENVDTMKKLLENHIVDNLVEVTINNEETIITTNAGQHLTLTVKQNPFRHFGYSLRNFGFKPQATVGCARVVRSNVRACNGLVHFIDRVLQVPTGTVMDVLKSRTELSEFVTLIEMSGVEEELADFSGTVLAPNNDAIENYLGEDEKKKILADKEQFSQFVKQHFLEDKLCCHQFGSREFFTQPSHRTLAGTSLVSGLRRIGGANIDNCDQLATDGIVHVIDRPIIRRRINSFADLLDRMVQNRGRGRSVFDNFEWP